MIHDLADLSAERIALEAEVIIIGAGIAGLLLANRLCKARRKVLVLESGGRTQEDDRSPLNEVVQLGQLYVGAEHGRFRCLGGTSTRWGGAMLPFWPEDMGAHTAGWDVDWPVSIGDVIGYCAEIEQLFHLPADPFECSDQFGLDRGGEPDAILRSAKYPAFRRRNVATLLKNALRSNNLNVWLNATVTKFHLGHNGRARSVTARSHSGSEINASAPTFVIAAGAIESTRLLLLADTQNDDRIFGPTSVLGRYFYDHLSARTATITPLDAVAFNKAFGLRFGVSHMRDSRLEPLPSARRKRRLPAAFANIIASPTHPGGFDVLRSVYRKLQRRVVPSADDALDLVRNSGWIARAAWWRFVVRRLLAPSDARFELNLVVEQMPHPDNLIKLSSERCDMFGQPLAVIDWRIREADFASFGAMSNFFSTVWTGSVFERIARYEEIPEKIWRVRLLENSGIFHPGGSTRMGSDASSAVVDRDLRCFRVQNIRVVSTSVFPSGGGANPSLMLMLFALRAAEAIDRELQSRPTKIGSESSNYAD